MYKITFPAAALKDTNALYMPHHSEVPVTECEHGMLIEYTEFRRHYVLHIPWLSQPYIAGDSAEIVEILLHQMSTAYGRLIQFLTDHNIDYGELYVVNFTQSEQQHLRDRRYYYQASVKRQAHGSARHSA